MELRVKEFRVIDRRTAVKDLTAHRVCDIRG